MLVSLAVLAISCNFFIVGIMAGDILNTCSNFPCISILVVVYGEVKAQQNSSGSFYARQTLQ